MLDPLAYRRFIEGVFQHDHPQLTGNHLACCVEKVWAGLLVGKGELAMERDKQLSEAAHKLLMSHIYLPPHPDQRIIPLPCPAYELALVEYIAAMTPDGAPDIALRVYGSGRGSFHLECVFQGIDSSPDDTWMNVQRCQKYIDQLRLNGEAYEGYSHPLVHPRYI